MGFPTTLRSISVRGSMGFLRVAVLSGALMCGTVAFLDSGRASAQLPKTPTEWSLKPEQVYETAISADSLLAVVSLVAIAPSGEAYVMDAIPPRVFVYDRSGRLLRTMGRRGAGPGEFQSASAMGFVGDSLWVADPGLARTTIFDAAGSVAATVLARVGGGAQRIVPFTLLRDGSAMGVPESESLRSLRGRDFREIDWSTFRWPVLRMTRDGVTTDTAEILTSEHGPVVVLASGRLIVPPLSERPLLASVPGGGGFVRVDRTAARKGGRSTFEVRWIGVGRGEDLRREYPYEPIPTSGAFRDSVENKAIATLRGGGGDSYEDAKKALRGRLFLPHFLPPVSDRVLVDRERTVWVRREDVNASHIRWDVLSYDGTRWATVLVPRNLRLEAVEGDQAWGVLSDETGDFRFVRYRVERASPGR